MGIRYRSIACLCHCDCGEHFFAIFEIIAFGSPLVATCPICHQKCAIDHLPMAMQPKSGLRVGHPHVCRQNLSMEGSVATEVMDHYRQQLSTVRIHLFALEGIATRLYRTWKKGEYRDLLREPMTRLSRALHCLKEADIARPEKLNQKRAQARRRPRK